MNNDVINKVIKQISEQTETLIEDAMRKEFKRCFNEKEWHGVKVYELANRDIEQFIKDQDIIIVREGGELETPTMSEGNDFNYFYKGKITPVTIKVYQRL